MDLLAKHVYRVGPHQKWDLADEQLSDTSKFRRQIEPWLAAVFQSEHFSLLLGSGFTNGVAAEAGGVPVHMSKCAWIGEEGTVIDTHAERSARLRGRGAANIEDQFRSAMQLLSEFDVLGDSRAGTLKEEIDTQIKHFVTSILDSERSIKDASGEKKTQSENLLVSFLLSFASRTASRERLNLFTTNYDRLIEHGCDLAGLRMLDRFVGALMPAFRASRLDVDMHYNPPGIRGEPRYLEGVIRLCKLHGSLDWRWQCGELRRCDVPLGAPGDHPAIPSDPFDSVVIYPNPAKDVETLYYPYAELFRDFASAICRPNSSLVIYGYGFGDEHVNRIIRDMLTIPSTHLVIMAWDETNPDDRGDEANSCRLRVMDFCRHTGKPAQISLLLGSHFAGLRTLVDNYLPKPAIDQISIRKTRLEDVRGEGSRGAVPEDDEHDQAN